MNKSLARLGTDYIDLLQVRARLLSNMLPEPGLGGAAWLVPLRQLVPLFRKWQESLPLLWMACSPPGRFAF